MNRSGLAEYNDTRQIFHLCTYFKKNILFIHERHNERERGRKTGRGRSRLHAGTPTWDLIPGLQDQALGQRQALNCWATRAALCTYFFIYSRKRERTRAWIGEKQREKEQQAPPWAGNLTQDSIPGPRDHDLSWRQLLNGLSHSGAPTYAHI